MIWIALMALAAAQPAEVASSAEPPVYSANFAPLLKSERRYAALGPVGPYFPEAAVIARQNGEAILLCHAGAAGVLERCKVISETPAGYYFGAAAQRMAQRRRITVAAPSSLGDQVYVRVPFEIGSPVAVEP